MYNSRFCRAVLPPRIQSLARNGILGLGAGMLLAACGGDVSDQLAMDPPFDLSLEQCELANVGVVGTPTDPVTIDGEETQACVLNTELPEGVQLISLKNSHRYEPLVWVLEGTYHIGESKTYGTLSELEEDPVVTVRSSDVDNYPLYVRENTLVIIHRNGRLQANLKSVDDDAIGGGEWGGVVVNGAGYHPDCPADTSASKLCNIEGPWGYFGGLSLPESREYEGRSSTLAGMNGAVAEAGGEVSGVAQPGAALVLNAPLSGITQTGSGVFYSSGNALEVNGGDAAITLNAMGNHGHAAVWQQDFSGSIGGIVYHGISDVAALKGEAGDQPVSLRNMTLVDRDLTAGTALQLTGTHQMDNLVIQGFAACLQFDGASGASALQNSIFYCGETAVPGPAGGNEAAQLIAGATNFYEEDPDLTPSLGLSNPDIDWPTGSSPGGGGGSVRTVAGYNLGLFYEPCYGVGTLLDETLSLGPNQYRVCELESTVTGNFKFDDDINDDRIAWVLKGNVQIGESFAGLDTQQQLERLANPQSVIMNGQSRIFGRAGSSLTINPGVALRARGSRRSAITLSSIDSGTEGAGEWAGVTIKGLADSCASAEVCQLAGQNLVDVSYLRILEAGAGGSALTLNQLSAGARLSYLDVSGSAAGGILVDGGAPNLDHIIMAQVAGDQVAWRNGYRGTLQYAVLTADNDSQGHALRGQNRADDHDASPRSRPVLANITAVGADKSASGILLEQGSGLLLYNSVFTGFPTCLDIDDAATAALQSADPKGIHFGGVVLDCGATLAAEDEDGGFDYGYVTQTSGEVYEVPAVVDTQFVAAGEEIPAAGSIDPGLPGDAAAYLNLGAAWMGAVRDSVDTWFAGWSDSVYVELSAECDFKGTLEDPADFWYEYSEDIRGSGVEVSGSEVTRTYRLHKVCSLRGTLTEDFHLTAYTGADREAVEAGGKVAGDFRTNDSSSVHQTDVEAFAPLPTVWLLNGMVHVGEGHRELTDLAQVQAMKETPVTLTIDPATIIMATEGAGLHVTRGGALRVLGGPHYTALELSSDDDRNSTGPINMMGLVPGEGGVFLFAADSLSTGPAIKPIERNSGNWVGLIVDGFARNNQCPDAATAEPDSQLCNIPGEYGYHGGYDDDHANVFIEHLNLGSARYLKFNSVGRGGTIEYLKWKAPSASLQGQGLAFNGGTVNMQHIDFGGSPYGSPFVTWDNGFRGTLQHINYSAGFPTATEAMAEEGWSYPIIRGSNGEPGKEDALPRSRPTLANLSLRANRIFQSFPPGQPTPSDGPVIDLMQGSGLYLYNSLIGNDPPLPPFLGTIEPAAYCFTTDETSAPLVGSDIVVDNFAYSCNALAEDDIFTAALLGDSKSNIMDRWEYVFSPWTPNGAKFEEIEELKILTAFGRGRLPAQDIVDLGGFPLDFSSSTTVDSDFITETNYLGSQDYFLFQEYGAADE